MIHSYTYIYHLPGMLKARSEEQLSIRGITGKVATITASIAASAGGSAAEVQLSGGAESL
jgi:hypothetical protein